MEGDVMWVICRDYGMEGLGEPLVVVNGEDDARATFAMMRKSHSDSFALFKVPLYPDVVQQETERKDKP